MDKRLTLLKRDRMLNSMNFRNSFRKGPCFAFTAKTEIRDIVYGVLILGVEYTIAYYFYQQ